MKLIYSILIGICTFPTLSNAQVVLNDDFESYDLTFLAAQADHWRMWFPNFDGPVVSTFNGTNQVLKMQGFAGDGDLLLLIQERPQTGSHAIQWDMFIPQGQSGYFGMEGKFFPNGGDWETNLNGGPVFFNRDGATPGIGVITGSPGQSFAYPEDEWFTVRNVYDLDSGVWAMYINNVLQFNDQVIDDSLQYPFVELAAINFYGIDNNNEYYFDNFNIEANPVAGIEDQDLPKVSVFPVPMKNTVAITSNGNISSITILNMLGQELFKNTVNNVLETSIDTSQLALGSYFIKATVDGTERIIQVIKE